MPIEADVPAIRKNAVSGMRTRMPEAVGIEQDKVPSFERLTAVRSEVRSRCKKLRLAGKRWGRAEIVGL